MFSLFCSNWYSPLDIAEATYLLPPPNAPLSTTNLIATHAVALQKQCTHLAKLTSDVYSPRIKAVIRFEQEHSSTITDYNFKLRDLVLIRNTAIEKSLNRKMHARYISPLIVISWNKGGAYIISELNGSVFDRPITTFRVITYFVRQHIDVPPLDELIDITSCRLCELEETTLLDLDNEDEDLAANWYPSPGEDNEEDWGQSIFQLGGEILTNFSNFSFACFCTFIHIHSSPFTFSLQLQLSVLRKRFYWQWSILSLSSFKIFAKMTNIWLMLYFRSAGIFFKDLKFVTQTIWYFTVYKKIATITTLKSRRRNWPLPSII